MTRIGTVVHRVGRVESTMDTAQDLDRDGAVAVAEAQTAGRGRQGRTWTSEPGGLYLSALLRPEAPVDRLGLVPLWTGLAVRDVLARLDVEATVSWPNDVLVGGRKIAGTLATSRLEASPRVVVGIGLNVANPLPEEVRVPATRLADHVDAPVAPDDVLEMLLPAWSARYEAFEADPGSCLDDLREACRTLGREVAVRLDGETLRGPAVDVAPDGGLVVEDGGRRTVRAGDVEEVSA